MKNTITALLIFSVFIAKSQTTDSLQISLGDNREPFHYSYHFLSFNDYNPGKGTVAWQNVWLSFNQLSVGVTNHVTVNGGFILGADLKWIGAKAGIPLIENWLNIGFAARAFFANGEHLILYTGQLTFGPRTGNISIGLSQGSETRDALLTVKGMVGIGKRFYVFTENYFAKPYEFGGDTVIEELISMIGGRAVIGKRVSLDFGVLLLPDFPFNDRKSLIALPILGLTVPLHKKR